MASEMNGNQASKASSNPDQPTGGPAPTRKPLGRPIAASDEPLAFPSGLHAVDPRSGSVVDRRSGIDRRLEAEANDTNLERRRGPGRRLTDFVKAAEEGELTQEQFLFVMAIDAFKQANGKTFPTWTDVLEIIRKLGYRKTMASELRLGERAIDWTEKPDAPSGVWKDSQEGEERESRRKAA
jgi:hypothetical protein